MLDLPFEVSAPWLPLAGLGLLLLQWPLRRGLRWLLGPLFVLETTRLARRGTAIWLRCLYAVALLLALYRSFPHKATADKNEIARFAEDFSELFLTVQTVAVFFLVPLVFGGAISDDKERRSLDFLLMSHLSARQIVLAKYASRVLNVAGLMLAGLPVLALTALWGGVDVLHAGIVFTATFLWLLSVGAVSLLWSVECPRTVHAVSWSYVTAIALSLCCASPVSFLLGRVPLLGAGDPVDALGLFALMHGSIVVLALGLAALELRRRTAPGFAPIEVFRRPPLLQELDLPPAPVPTVALTSWRPIGRDALLWKERYLGRVNEPFFEAMWLYFAGILATLALPAFLIGWQQVRQILAVLYLVLLGLLTIGLCLGLLIDLAGAITREREQCTLESVLTLPITRGRLLRTKVLGALFRRLRWVVAIVFLLGVCLTSGVLPVLTVALLGALIASQAIFVAGVALLTSVLARTTVRAHVLSLAVVAAVVASTAVIARYDDNPSSALVAHSSLAEALNPVTAWLLAMRDGIDGARRALDAQNVLQAAALYVGAGVVLARLAHWHFRRSERYT